MLCLGVFESVTQPPVAGMTNRANAWQYICLLCCAFLPHDLTRRTFYGLRHDQARMLSAPGKRVPFRIYFSPHRPLDLYRSLLRTAGRDHCCGMSITAHIEHPGSFSLSAMLPTCAASSCHYTSHDEDSCGVNGSQCEYWQPCWTTRAARSIGGRSCR